MPAAIGKGPKSCYDSHKITGRRMDQLLDQAVQDGAQLIFTTTPQLGHATLKAAVRYSMSMAITTAATSIIRRRAATVLMTGW